MLAKKKVHLSPILDTFLSFSITSFSKKPEANESHDNVQQRIFYPQIRENVFSATRQKTAYVQTNVDERIIDKIK
jgi:type IV secretory pathway VirB4 component